ncbi:acetyl-CoA synthetase [Rhodotorula sp. JG-1b]|nr:acetyl-CoA synthetase [Rhodotorula sp. JG-1b]
MAASEFHYDTLHQKLKDGIPCPVDFSFPSHVLSKWARIQPSQPALHWVSHDFATERIVTYRELDDLTHRAAKAFCDAGLKKGDRVLIQLPRIVEWWPALYGLMRMGAIPCPGTSLLVSKDLKFRAEASKAKAFIGDVESCARFEEVAAETGISLIFQARTPGDGGLGNGRIDFQAAIEKVPSGTKCEAPEGHKKTDLALIFFTSGTTGAPKMVLLEVHTITGYWYQAKPGTMVWCMADLGWAKASYGSMGTFNMGATYFVQPPPPGAFTPNQLIDSLNRYPIATLCAPPTIYRSLVTTSARAYLKSHPPKALRHCVGAGEPLNASVIKEWQEMTNVQIKDGWGQSETVIAVGNFEGISVREGSMGKVSPFFEVSIIDHEGRELADGEEGELAIRADTGAGAVWIFKGYVKNGKIDRRTKTHSGKTWYCTGDRGVRDPDGYFWFVGRDDDVITSSGYRIGPFEVESALKTHPAVAESAAVGSPDLGRGEIVKAFVILSEEFRDKTRGDKDAEQKLIADIQTHFKKVTAPYKAPRAIEFVEELPKTVSGKIRRVELRELEQKRKADVLKQQRAKL